MKTLTTQNINKLTDEELLSVCGGSFWEGELGGYEGCKYIDIYRAGVTYVNCAFGADEFYVGSKRISKELANRLTLDGRELWKDKYKESGDLIGFTKEWRMILKNTYGIDWDGKMGDYKVQVF